MRFIDLSQPIFDGAPNCPVHPPVQVEIIANHEKDDWRLERLTLATHTGTHIDAPLHKISGGRSLDEMSLETFSGDSLILHLDGIGENYPIGPQDFEALPDALEGKIILLDTGWGDKRGKTHLWWNQSPYLAPDGARWLLEKGIKGVGIDHYSIGGSRDPMNTETHTILLGHDIWIVEDLYFPSQTKNLHAVVQFLALPIKLQGASGAFCRAVLMEN